ncbi:MAG: histidine triad nucleotide-binding protein [Ignavibacteria bacterium]|nr:histidine triad nucleotide-binding protein [Ignavibacteria bacterium]
MAETIFLKIIRKEIPAKIEFENEYVLAFHDINPQAPVHVLIIPKQEIPRVTDLEPGEHAKILAEMVSAANIIAKKFGIDESGFRLVMNCNADGGQEVYHLHMHLLGGRKMTWPPG